MRSQRGQVLILMVAAVFVLTLGVSVFGALGKALLGKGRYQRAADLAAVSAARAMRDDFSGLFEPPFDGTGRANPRHLEKHEYLSRARRAALEIADQNGADTQAVRVEFPDARSFAPVRVSVRLIGEVTVHRPGDEAPASEIEVRAAAEAELVPPAGELGVPGMEERASGGGYSGPLAYRQGKPMRPDVALAFDRMEAAARRDGIVLIITSGFRSDTEQAKLFSRHPDPRWVAPPGKSLHRYATELDLAPPSAYAWLAGNAARFHFVKRYAWEPWHYGYRLNARSTPEPHRGAGRPGDGRSAVPAFVPADYAAPIAQAASRWNVSAALLAAQLYVESNFNPFAVSRAGARGIAQFMPDTAAAYGLEDPYDAAKSISAQAHLMRDLLRRFGSVVLSLAAYNTGSAAVERCGCVPPFAETRAYVAKIVGLMGGAGALPVAQVGLEVRLVS